MRASIVTVVYIWNITSFEISPLSCMESEIEKDDLNSTFI